MPHCDIEQLANECSLHWSACSAKNKAQAGGLAVG